MPWRQTARKIEEWVNRVLSLTSLLPASVGGLMTGWFGIRGDFPPFLVLAVSLLVFSTTLIALGMTANRKQRFAAIGVLAVLTAASVLYSLRVQKKQEEKLALEAAAVADNYYLDFAGFAPTINFQPSSSKPGQLVNVAIVGITVDNDNDFGLWMRSVRRNVSVDKRVSGDEQEEVLKYIPARSKDFRFVDSPISLDPPANVKNGLTVIVDFCIEFGKRKTKLTKALSKKGALFFQSRAGGGLYTPYFYPADGSPESDGYVKGC